MNELEKAVGQNLRRKRLLSEVDRIVIAVSGGLDSMVLLHLLQTLSKDKSWKLCVAHFNHCLRGKDSDADEQLVRRAAHGLGLTFLTDSADVRKVAVTHGISVEMAARKLRHEFLAQCAKKFRAKRIALAHHADDQLELFFLRLFRGSGSEALSGMKWHNPSPVDRRIELIRPLLDQPKSRLAGYASANEIFYREDASNESLDIQRNRIRHQVLPLLLGCYQPALPSTVFRVMDIVAAESEMVKAVATSWLVSDRHRQGAAFDALHLAVQRRVLQLQLERLGILATFDLVEKLRSAAGTAVTIKTLNGLGPESKPAKIPMPGTKTVQLFVTRDNAGMVSFLPKSSSRFKSDRLKVSLWNAPHRADFGGVRFDWRIQTKGGIGRLSPKKGWEWFDSEKVGKEIVLRHWQPGDRFHPIGCSKPLKIQDIFINEKIPRVRRHEAILACTNKGDIFWVEGLRISERFKLTDQTNRRLQWRWKRL